MKKTIMILSLLISSIAFQAQANDVGDITTAPTLIPTMLTASTGMSTTPGNYSKEAIQVINDGQEYFASGKLSPFLNSHVGIVLDNSSDLSTAEAVDLLMENAYSILN